MISWKAPCLVMITNELQLRNLMIGIREAALSDTTFFLVDHTSLVNTGVSCLLLLSQGGSLNYLALRASNTFY